YMRGSTVGITVIDMAGLYFTYLLVQKSVKIHNPAADRVCGVLQAGGCDSILKTSASKFFGLFGWSEVGFAYFSVSLLTLLLLPGMLPWLALCNLICLPFTAWSIWYQRFRAHKWCTLCVCVQGSLWLLFFCYCFGGWLGMAWPLSPLVLPLGAAYIAVMLALNAVMPLIENSDTNNTSDHE
ncbi:MAG: vitamin K epoxide reductase family protein, partial [Muribaculaceae bacterium]|nr:vitamin K epoxide reductase family protein [Muribaculaceae bacterium]